MDYRSDIIVETTLGIMGTISGPRPLFLLGHHGLTSDRKQLALPVTPMETREMQKASRHTTKGKSIAHNPRPEKGFPCLWSKPCSKSLGSTGTETKHMQVQGHAGSMCQRGGSSQGRTPAKETLWRQSWLPPDWKEALVRM